MWPHKNDTLMKKNKGQVIIEFTFCVIVVMLMMYGLIMIFRWTGVSMANRRIGHDSTLEVGFTRNYGSGAVGQGPLKQLDTYFFKPSKMKAVWDGN